MYEVFSNPLYNKKMPFISFDINQPTLQINLNQNIEFNEMSLVELGTDEMNILNSSINSLIITLNDYNTGTHCFNSRSSATNYFSIVHAYHNQVFSYSKRAGEEPDYRTDVPRRTSNLKISILKPDGTPISVSDWNNSQFHIKLYYQ